MSGAAQRGWKVLEAHPAFKRARFGKPQDHRATRPGFQAPWGSQDLYQAYDSFAVVKGVTFGVVVSYFIFRATRYFTSGGTPASTYDMEWRRISQEREDKEKQ